MLPSFLSIACSKIAYRVKFFSQRNEASLQSLLCNYNKALNQLEQAQTSLKIILIFFDRNTRKSLHITREAPPGEPIYAKVNKPQSAIQRYEMGSKTSYSERSEKCRSCDEHKIAFGHSSVFLIILLVECFNFFTIFQLKMR